MGKQVCFQVINLLAYILFVVLMHVVYTDAFVDAHKGVFAALGILFSVAVWFSSSHFVIDQFLQGSIGSLYLVAMDVFLFSQYGAEEQSVTDLWAMMFFLTFAYTVIELIIWLLSDESETESSDETNASDITMTPVSPVRFDHPDFDFVLERLETDVAFFQQHAPIIGLEAIHQVEQVFKDLRKMCEHYQQIRAEQHPEAERLIETLCRYAETVTEECKAQVDTYHLTHLEKLTTKHVH